MADKNLTVNVKSKFDKSGFDKLNQNIDKTQANLKETTKGVSGLSSALAGGLAGGFAVVAAQMIPFVLNSIKTGAALSNLRAGFAGTAKDMELLRKATAGTVGEAGLIALSNQATDLGLTLEDQAKLFALAEDAGDKYGGSLEENFQKIVNATDGSAKGLRAVGVSTSEYKKKVEELTKSMGVKIDEMEAEEQLQIRLQAIFELTGTTLDTVNAKTVDAADMLEQLGLIVPEVTAAFGEGFVKAMQDSGNGAKDLTKILEDMKVIAKDVGGFVAGLASEMKTMLEQDLKDIDKIVQATKDLDQFMVDLILNSDAPTWIKNLMATNNLGNTPPIPEGPDTPMTAWEQNKPKVTTTTKKPTTQTTKGGQTKTKEAEKEKEILTEIDRLQKEIIAKEEIKQKYVTDNLTNTQAYFELLNEIIALEEKRKQLLMTPEQLDVYLRAATTQTLLETLAASIEKLERPLGKRGEIDKQGLESLSGNVQNLETDEEKRLAAIEGIAAASSTIFDNVNATLQLLGVETSAFVNKIIQGFNFVATILETIKAINLITTLIPFLATGGIMQSSGLAVVGERGPELVSLPAGARVYNNQDTQRYFNNVNSAPQAVNVYVNANMDGLKFLENNMPKYFDKRNYKRIN